ncbi:tetratricopeptide repeat protein [Nitrincola schmidtii]|uniref:tetratricopeptide repeat protein n=1 Tax=Nitrincola schmidtii TaxID=1730894 RepID=UPI00124CD163|nr:tetratricopeptide repeat protein [Nitrincola schmidtii]
MNKLLWVLLLTLLISGCSGLTHDTTETQPFDVLDTPLPEVKYEQGQLNREILVDLITAEMSGHIGLYDDALSLYLNQARNTQDAAVAERATRIAQFMRNSKAVITSAKLWADAAPHSQEPRELLAGILLHEGRFNEALPWLETLLIDAESDAALLISSQAETIDPTTASQYLELIETILVEQPQRTDLHLATGLLFIRIGEEDAAMRAFDRGLMIEPYQPQLVMQKVELLRQRDEITPALQLINRAALRHPESNQLQIQQAQLLMLSGQFQRAEQLMTSLLEERHRDTQLHLYFALLLLDHQQYESSRDLLESLKLKSPDNPEVDFYLGHLAQQRGDRELALSYYSAVEQGNTFLQARARMLELFNDPAYQARVENTINKAITLQPGLRTGLVIVLAEWYKTHDLKPLALERLTNEINKSPTDTRLLYTRALFHEPEQPEKTLSDLRRVLELDPDNPVFLNALGYTMTVHTDDYETAHSLISRALEQQPNDAATLDSMGWVLFKLNRADEALFFLQRAYDLFPDPEVVAHLVRVLNHLGRHDDATTLLEDYLSRMPDNRHLLDALERIEIE